MTPRPQGWDEPWYRVRTKAFEAVFLPGPDEDLDAVCNVDVLVNLQDGSRWTATVFTLTEVARLMEVWAESGEALGGRYFWVTDGLIVRDAGVDGSSGNRQHAGVEPVTGSTPVPLPHS
ncbi:hypothetical protein [Streptomyces sp. NPDC087300]|uniref:hypothetical protein n=1 Tax=Streptomyces sp. NPDC087300 TaxID=3365780 RepID=UPI00380E8C36